MKNFRLVVYTLLLTTVSMNIVSSERLGSKAHLESIEHLIEKKVVGLSEVALNKMMQQIDQEINKFTSEIEKAELSGVEGPFVLKELKRYKRKLEAKKEEIQNELDKLSK